MTLSIDQLTRPLKVARRIQETPDAVSFVFEIPKELINDFVYQAGQFVTLFLDINGESLNRSYSLCSSPLTDTEFQITVKKVAGGKGSTYLCEQVREGQILRVTKPAGHFFKPALTATQYFLIAAGSGITPVFSILKTVLAANPANSVHVLYCNRNQEAIIYSGLLKELVAKNSDRLHIHHLLSQPSAGWTGATGRCSPVVVGKLLEARRPKMDHEYYICGPDSFMDVARKALDNLKIERSSIHQESFAVGLQPHSAALKEDWTYIGDKTKAQANSGGHLIAMVQGETIECEVGPDQSILEALLEAGANPPYSCMDGACMACMAKVKDGLVYQKDPGILTEENIENREALTCQARVLSPTVKVSYDEI